VLYLFRQLLNSPEANYKARARKRRKEKEKKHTKKTKEKGNIHTIKNYQLQSRQPVCGKKYIYIYSYGIQLMS
jgi:uncharacterized protein YbbK (DUF523 family)